MALTVACVWVRANVPYSVEYVTNLRAMVARHLSRPHRFVCLTDRPEQLPKAIEGIQITHDRRLFGWWAKLECFMPGRLTGRVLYLDLDTIVVDALDPIVDYPASFAMVPPGGTFKPKDGRQTVTFGNSSVMVWDAGVADAVYRDWTPRVADRLWGDQCFLGEKALQGVLPAKTMPADWFPRLSSLKESAPKPPAKVVLAKVPKNAVAADLYPWVQDAWRAA